MVKSQDIRYNKLYYAGPGVDPIPLPLAKTAVYVDIGPNQKPLSHYKNEESMLQKLIKKAKRYFQHSREPRVKWSEIDNYPIAEVIFTWDTMPGLTRKGEKTHLTFLFNTGDEDMCLENLRHFMKGIKNMTIFRFLLYLIM